MARTPAIAVVERAGVWFAERATGYVTGGISPPGRRRPLPTHLDAAALEHGIVLVNGGRRGVRLELDLHDLAHLTSASVPEIAG
jgi:Cys-tRNA(Pro)/Cys-tRNA(Cys) deacylase